MITSLLSTEQRTAIERWCRDRAMAIPMDDKRTLCRVLGEFKVVIALEDLSIAPHLALDGYWEIWNAMRLAKYVKPGMQVIDVGANFGYFSLLLAELVGPSGHVEAWEPDPLLCDCLRKSFRLFPHQSLSLRPEAASDARRELGAVDGARLVRPRVGDYGSAYLALGSDVAHGVETARLDQTDLSRVDFVKIDAEGHEPAIWQGMSGLFDRGEPRAMLMEWTPSRYDDPKAFKAEIEGRGYKLSVVDGTGDLRPPEGDITTIEGYLDLWLERAG